jgi:hypothetical protein
MGFPDRHKRYNHGERFGTAHRHHHTMVSLWLHVRRGAITVCRQFLIALRELLPERQVEYQYERKYGIWSGTVGVLQVKLAFQSGNQDPGALADSPQPHSSGLSDRKADSGISICRQQ